MEGTGSGLSARSPRIEGRMPAHRISRAFVLHRDVVPTATLVTRRQTASADHGVRAARRRLPPQTTGRLATGVKVKGPPKRGFAIKFLQPVRKPSPTRGQRFNFYLSSFITPLH